MAHLTLPRAWPRAAAFLLMGSVGLPAFATTRGETCGASPNGPGCDALARWCQDDRFVEADPAACKFADGRTASKVDEDALKGDCEAKSADGACAVLLERCEEGVPDSLRALCRDAARWRNPPPPPPPRPERSLRDRDEDDDDRARDEESVVVRSSAPLGLDLGLGAWSADGTTLAAAELGYSFRIIGSLALDLEAQAAMPLDFGSAYVRGQGALRYALNLGGIGLRLAGGAGWDGTVMGTTPRAPGEAWALASVGLSMSLDGCMELCDWDDVHVSIGVNGEARYVLGTGPRSRVDRLAEFDDTVGEFWLGLPLPMSPRISLRSANQFTSASWTGLFLTLTL